MVPTRSIIEKLYGVYDGGDSMPNPMQISNVCNEPILSSTEWEEKYSQSKLDCDYVPNNPIGISVAMNEDNKSLFANCGQKEKEIWQVTYLKSAITYGWINVYVVADSLRDVIAKCAENGIADSDIKVASKLDLKVLC